MTRVPVAETLTPKRPSSRVLAPHDENRVVQFATPTPGTKKSTAKKASLFSPDFRSPVLPLRSRTPRKTPLTINTPRRTPLNNTPTPSPCCEEENELSKEQQFRYVCLSRCAEEEEAFDGLEPWTLNDFEYLGPLGSGGTATVFKARERQSGYEVALKILDGSDEDGLCEIDIHASLEHPNIVQMFDYFYCSEEEKQHFGPPLQNEQDKEPTPNKKAHLVMILELCGQSLWDVIRDDPKGHLSEQQAATYFYDMLDALEYLHLDHEMIHCDVKTLNFLTCHGNQLKLADFGMTVRDDGFKEVVGGSPIYMAPEHLLAWQQLTGNFDSRSDLYSLGVVLFESIVGYLPYQVLQKEDDDSVVAALLEEGPVLDLRQLDEASAEDPIYVPPPLFPEFVSEEAQDLISRLMEAKPEDRIDLDEAKEHAWFRKNIRN